MSKSSAQPIGAVLKDVVEKLSQAKKKDVAAVFSRWTTLVGKELARHTRPVSLRQGTLWVNVDTSAWLYQATLLKEKLLANFKKTKELPKIKNIQFRMGILKG